jgi:glutamine---fructose-6-phosphate transaminase (isomerizing)
MCGIIAAVAQRELSLILLEGLRRLEYRGYDSAGMATIDDAGEIQRLRSVGKIAELSTALARQSLQGKIGIAHTRWATHGKPSEANAHPHVAGDRVAVVHNGIIENHHALRDYLRSQHCVIISETDSELIAHLIHLQLEKQDDLMAAVSAAQQQLKGAYALAVIDKKQPHRLVGARCGSPLVLGIGVNEHYIASDTLAIEHVANACVYLQEGDTVELCYDTYCVRAHDGNVVTRSVEPLQQVDAVSRGHYRHFMQKEIYQQPGVLAETLAGRISDTTVLSQIFGSQAADIFDRCQQVHIVACGTSYYAGLVGRHWLESVAKVTCHVEVASEYRYRDNVVPPGTLFVCISQSGETADTLAALKQAKQLEYEGYLAICNVATSSLVREADLVFLTRAGVEIGVASTKAFTTQMVALLLLTLSIAKHNQQLSAKVEAEIVQQLHQLSTQVERALALEEAIAVLAKQFANKEHALFLGRGEHFPIALEGALKLKELSYIHAEAYPAGELKHGPLALVDENMPVVAVAPNDQLLEKLCSNIQEVQARGGQLYVFADPAIDFPDQPSMHVVKMPVVDRYTSPIVYTIPLQLLAYHAALIKGTDVDQPRNLAKSVTVE